MVPKLRSFWVNRVVILLVWDEWMTIIHSEHQWKLIGSVQRFRKYRHWTSRPSIIRELMRWLFPDAIQSHESKSSAVKPTMHFRSSMG